MKKIFLTIFQFILPLIILLIIICKITEITMSKESIYHKKQFFEHAGQYDVLFLGSSHMMEAVYPNELWEQYGISSYNLGSAGIDITVAYSVLENALQYNTPKLVVLDAFHNINNTKPLDNLESYRNNASYIHVALDSFPLSLTKYRSIQDIVDQPANRLEFLFPLSLYHSRILELDSGDFDPPNSSEFGATSKTDVIPMSNFIRVPNENISEDTVGLIYTQKIINLCKENDIQILLINLPYNAKPEEQQGAYAFHRIAGENDINFIDFLDLNVTNPQIDFRDHSHVNASGALKITSYIGKYMIDNYALNDYRGNTAYDFYDTCHSDYISQKTDTIKRHTTLYSLLMLLHDNDYSCNIHTLTDSYINQDSLAQTLISNISSIVTADNTLHDIPNQTSPDIQLTIIDNATGEIIKESYFESEIQADTIIYNNINEVVH